MAPERESEYNELPGYVGLFATVVWQIDPASATHPSNVIEGIVQQFGKSKALVGLRQAANDTIEEASNWNSEARAVADEIFRAASVVTVRPEAAFLEPVSFIDERKPHEEDFLTPFCSDDGNVDL